MLKWFARVWHRIEGWIRPADVSAFASCIPSCKPSRSASIDAGSII
jgi:hypothetical protein